MSGQDTPASISFGRESQTGHAGNPGLPAGVLRVSHPSEEVDATLLYMPSNGGIGRLGAFYCQANIDNVTTKITTIILNKNGMWLLNNLLFSPQPSH